ncbi:sensor histidine kinase [Streptomyces niveus]|uniref:sensor histidine kinase n=1 Tax=Streptomyces niveus TaxID=193462 RepID=UPI0036BF778B
MLELIWPLVPLLHDIVAHPVTAMTVQAGVALDALDTRPEISRKAMRQVRDSGREAVRELRATTSRPPRCPGSRDCGNWSSFEGGDVELVMRREGEFDGLSPMVELAVHRIVQEALTNVVRHSGARRAAVSLVRHDDRLTVEIANDGAAGGAGELPLGRGGFGLIGMRERAAAAGGGVEYGPVPGGGFLVRAWLPAERSETGS